jgi:hypothetical protein
MGSYSKLPDDEGELWGVMVSYLMMKNYGELW